MNRSRIIQVAGPLGLYASARWLTRKHPRILMYHRFSSIPHPDFVCAEAFDEQVRHLARRHHIISLDVLLESLRAGQRLPPNTLVITVDDGYQDFFDVAFPVLQRHRVPATLFVATGFVDGELWLWPDKVRWALDQATETPSEVRVAGITVSLSNGDPWSRIIGRLLALPDTEKQLELERLAYTLGVVLPEAAPTSYAAVTWDQLRILQAAGVEIGGHTHTHPTLPKVAPERLPEEIDHCKRRLDAELGVRSRPFCYPNGQPTDYSETVRDAVEQAGFTGAVVAYADSAGHEDLFALRRHSSSSNRFQFHKAASGLEWLGRRFRASRGSA